MQYTYIPLGLASCDNKNHKKFGLLFISDLHRFKLMFGDCSTFKCTSTVAMEITLHAYTNWQYLEIDFIWEDSCYPNRKITIELVL